MSEVQIILKDYSSRQMYQRRNPKLLPRDIYVIGYSLVNLHMKWIFRPVNAENTDDQTDEKEELPTAEIMDTVAALKEQVVDFTGTVKTLKRRIEFIENTLTESQIKELSSKESLDNSEGLIQTSKATSEDNSTNEPKTIRHEIVIESTEVQGSKGSGF